MRRHCKLDVSWELEEMKGRVETSSVTRHIDGMLRVALLRIGPTARPTLLLRRVVKPVRTVSRALLHKRAGLLASGSFRLQHLPNLCSPLNQPNELIRRTAVSGISLKLSPVTATGSRRNCTGFPQPPDTVSSPPTCVSMLIEFDACPGTAPQDSRLLGSPSCF